MSSFADYARFESRRFEISDSEESEDQITLNNCVLCSNFDYSLCKFPCWNSFEDNKEPEPILVCLLFIKMETKNIFTIKMSFVQDLEL